jgi:hypothetical protein
MGLAPASSFFRRLMARQRGPVKEDPADMGTAFGLEASLGPVSAYPSQALEDRAPGTNETPMSWLGRRSNRPR